MKYNYCSRCNIPSKKLFTCKYEKSEEDWFLLCFRCVLECRNIYKKLFKNIFGEFVSIGIFKTRKERSQNKKKIKEETVLRICML